MSLHKALIKTDLKILSGKTASILIKSIYFKDNASNSEDIPS